MRYSVWNPATRAYNIYESNQHPTNIAVSTSALGSTPDDVTGLLPEDAVEVGVNESPEGQIVKTTIGFSGFVMLVAASVVARAIYGYISGK